MKILAQLCPLFWLASGRHLSPFKRSSDRFRAIIQCIGLPVPSRVRESKERVICVGYPVAHGLGEKDSLMGHDGRGLVPMYKGDALADQDLPKNGKERAGRWHAVSVHHRHKRHIVHLLMCGTATGGGRRYVLSFSVGGWVGGLVYILSLYCAVECAPVFLTLSSLKFTTWYSSGNAIVVYPPMVLDLPPPRTLSPFVIYLTPLRLS